MSFIELSAVLGNWGEFVGSIVVVVTLVYLTVQVRYTKQELSRSVGQERASASVNLHLNRVNNAALRRAYLKTSEPRYLQEDVDRFGISIEEADMLVWDRVAYWQYHSHTIAHIEDLPPEEHVAFDAAVQAQYTSPYVAAWYERTKSLGILNQKTVNYIDTLLEGA